MIQTFSFTLLYAGMDKIISIGNNRELLQTYMDKMLYVVSKFMLIFALLKIEDQSDDIE